MDSDLLVALFITLVGMTLLFLALCLFYGLLSLLTRLLPERSTAFPASGQEAAPAGGGLWRRVAMAARRTGKASRQGLPTNAEQCGIESEQERQAIAQAAAIGVALARAEAERKAHPHRPPPDELASSRIPSAWWTLHHRRQLDTNARRGR